MNFGDYLKIVRVNAGHSQRTLSAETGIATTLISRYENNRLNPRLDTLKKIGGATGVPLSSLLQAQTSHLARRKVTDHSNVLVPVVGQPFDVYFEHDRVVVNKGLLRHISFPTEILPGCQSYEGLVGYFIRDVSLGKAFNKDSFVLIDSHDVELGSGRFMCLLVNQKIEIKFVSMQSMSVFILSAADQQSLIPPIVLHRDHFQVIGAVMWHSEFLRQ